MEFYSKICSVIPIPMVVISKSILRGFGLKHPDSIDAINTWYRLVKAQNWASIADLRQYSNSVDYVGNDRFVFNLRGNKYRLIVMIFFDVRTIYVRFIGTHSEYNNIDTSTI